MDSPGHGLGLQDECGLPKLLEDNALAAPEQVCKGRKLSTVSGGSSSVLTSSAPRIAGINMKALLAALLVASVAFLLGKCT